MARSGEEDEYACGEKSAGGFRRCRVSRRRLTLLVCLAPICDPKKFTTTNVRGDQVWIMKHALQNLSQNTFMIA